MVLVFCPENNWNERAYIIEVILEEFLGIEYRLEPGSSENFTRLVLENDNEIIIEDHFFSKFRKEREYLDLANIPSEIIFAHNQFLNEEDIPVLFGNQRIEIENEKKGRLRVECGIDLFASSFFMLTRWEEYVSSKKDSIGRFSARECLAFKHDFLDRPVVNEYADFLWNMLQYSGIQQDRKKREFRVYLTHDVDFILKWYNFVGFARTLAGDLIKRKSIRTFLFDVPDYIMTQLKLKKDPFDTFNYLMSLSEAHDFKSHFFFMSVEPHSHLKNYKLSHPFVKRLFKDIEERGHIIGFHPDFNTYRDPVRWKKEKDRLQSSSPQVIHSGRQHYLQFHVPDTWQIWDDMEMEWDSSLSYDEVPGFRTGSCYNYPVFNFLTREKLSLRERTLNIMDKSLVLHNRDMELHEMENRAKNLINVGFADKVSFNSHSVDNQSYMFTSAA